LLRDQSGTSTRARLSIGTQRIRCAVDVGGASVIALPPRAELQMLAPMEIRQPNDLAVFDL
jgi:hypothetical protein